MHLTALVPALLSIVAFVLSLLALTAGRTPSYLPQLYVLRVNTTSIATSVDLPTLFAQLGITNTTSTGIPRLDSAISTLSADGLGDLLNTAAHELGLHDIYTAHATTWCEGALTSSGTRVTGCTTPAIPFSFNPVAIIESELLHNLTLKDMGFDSADVDRVVSALETAYRSMSICYLLGVLTAALCIVGCVFAVWQPARALAACNATAAGLTVLFLGAAAAIATVVGTRVKDVVNEKAKVINVQAENSTTFLAVSWIAVAFAIAVFTWWSASCCCRRGGRSVDKEAGMEKWGARGEMEQRNRRDRR
ncbi:actin cortical patch SUR7/pH-response regulator pali, partial [Geopyxis carbonaria]